MAAARLPLLRQRLHPDPYLHPTKGVAGGFPIQIGPPHADSEVCPWARTAIKRARQRLANLAEEEGEWVSAPMAEIPYDRLVDRDVILLGLAELWLARMSEGPVACPWVDARHDGISYIAAHPAKERLMTYEGKPLRVSPTWPASTGDKVFLDRVRKLQRGGLLAFHPDPIGSQVVRFTGFPGKVYAVALTELGFARILHLERRMRDHALAGRRLRELLGQIEVPVLT